MMQTAWTPVSSGPTLQQPSRWKPVSGSIEQGWSGVPRTLRGCLGSVLAWPLEWNVLGIGWLSDGSNLFQI